MREVVRQVRRIAETDANVLITGETGVGKDAIAFALHAGGPRRRHPFVKIDCPSLPAGLLEAELFGHERGAFTDAATARPGRFELAGPGTVYLDNVGELPIDVQGKLLRVVAEKQVERLGGTAPVMLRARIVASATSDLEEGVRNGTFREDLYHRLRVLPLRVPPLRERRADIAPLARRFARDAVRRQARRAVAIARTAVEALQRYRWPGNVRELQHVMERAMLALPASRTVLSRDDLPIEVLGGPDGCFAPDDRRRPTLAEVEQRYIELVLREMRGNQTETARVLGISRKALWERRKKMGLHSA